MSIFTETDTAQSELNITLRKLKRSMARALPPRWTDCAGCDKRRLCVNKANAWLCEECK